MKDVPRVQMPGKANSRAYVEATHYDWLVHEMEGLRRKLDEALRERDAMGAERDRLAAELAEERAKCAAMRLEMNGRSFAQQEAEALRAELSAARAALEFYADPQNYISGRMAEGGHFYLHHVQWDAGKRAREALQAELLKKVVERTAHLQSVLYGDDADRAPDSAEPVRQGDET